MSSAKINVPDPMKDAFENWASRSEKTVEEAV